MKAGWICLLPLAALLYAACSDNEQTCDLNPDACARSGVTTGGSGGSTCGTGQHCDDGNECTTDVCNADGTCSHPIGVDARCSLSPNVLGYCDAKGACVSCTKADQCPAPAGQPCQEAACDKNACGQKNVTDGTPVPGMEKVGDCKKAVCKGGVVSQEPDSSDQDDANDCTTDSCGSAGASHVAVISGIDCDNHTGSCQGGTCKHKLGTPCKSNDACESNNACADGVCCNNACQGPCIACDLGPIGTCELVPAGMSGGCSHGQICNGVADCVDPGAKKAFGASCSGDVDCFSGACASGTCKNKAGDPCTPEHQDHCASGVCNQNSNTCT